MTWTEVDVEEEYNERMKERLEELGYMVGGVFTSS